MRVTFYGVGGSTSVSGAARVAFGTNTSCTLIDLGGRYVIFDMGTGLVSLSAQAEALGLESADIFISHFHYDHIEGFGFFKPFFSENASFTIHAVPQDGYSTEGLLSGYLRAPFSPITPSHFPASIKYRELIFDSVYNLNTDLTIRTTALNHPSGSTAYRLEYGGKSLVYMLDHEHSASFDDRLIAFCHNADLIIYDAMFTQAEYDSGAYTGWGHSTPEMGIALCKNASAKRIALTHHATWRTDKEFMTMENHAQKLYPHACLAREGMVITL